MYWKSIYTTDRRSGHIRKCPKDFPEDNENWLALGCHLTRLPLLFVVLHECFWRCWKSLWLVCEHDFCSWPRHMVWYFGYIYPILCWVEGARHRSYETAVQVCSATIRCMVCSEHDIDHLHCTSVLSSQRTDSEPIHFRPVAGKYSYVAVGPWMSLSPTTFLSRFSPYCT